MLKSLSDAGRVTWESNVKDILFRCGFGHVWINQAVGDAKLFLEILKVRLRDCAEQYWSAGINSMSKLSTYCQFKSSLSLQSYNTINMQKKYKIVLAKFRCTNHKLSIERFNGALLRCERICMFSVNNGIRVIEGEYHLISICPLYQHLRSTFLKGILRDNFLMHVVM